MTPPTSRSRFCSLGVLSLAAFCVLASCVLPKYEVDTSLDEPAGGSGGSAADARADSDTGTAGTSFEASPDAMLDAGDGPKDAAEAEACVPDTCVAHGYFCGKIDDGCGHTVPCMAPWEPWPTYDAACVYVGGHLWACGHMQPGKFNGFPPFQDCNSINFKYNGTSYMGWCCKEAS